MSGTAPEVFTAFTANNHVLFSLLAKGSVSLFGLSELALRLPTVMATVMFFWGAFVLARSIFGTGRLFLMTVVVTVFFLMAAHLIFEVRYPFGRTGLYLIVLFIFSMAAFGQHVAGKASPVSRVLAFSIWACFILLIGRSVTEFNTTYYYDWRSDAGTRKIFEIMAAWPRFADRSPVRIAVSPWLLKPSVDFYRIARRRDDIAPASENWEARLSDYDFFVVSPNADLQLARTQADVVYVHTDSGAVLLINRWRLRAERPPDLSPPGRLSDTGQSP